MTKIFRNIFILFLTTVGLSSCIFEYPEEPDTPDGMVAFHFNINTLAASSGSEVVEKIKSLRIIVLNEESVECNQYVALGTGTASDQFGYDFRWWTKPGTKSLIVIANEESVPSVTSELLENTSMSLTGLLDTYVEDSDAEVLVNIMNSLVFTPEYSTQGNEVFLPYSVIYQNIVLPEAPSQQAGPFNPVKIYLVPAATKFIFNFINYRSSTINIKGISISKINQKSYLLGHPSEDEYYKNFNTEKLYWVDWLAKIAENSWLHPGYSDNEDYNNEVGWIASYNVPNPEDAKVFDFIKEGVNNPLTIFAATTEVDDAGEDVIIPKSNSTGVYYLPESVNYERLGNQEDEDVSDGEQQFYLTLVIDEEGAKIPPPAFDNVVLPNLKALFRDTYVIVNVKMSEGDLEVYAEIAPWNKKTANGWVVDGNPPPNNPFLQNKRSRK